jgi:hypothetical protein
MCSPLLALAGVGAAASIGGGIMSSQAQSRAASAMREQNMTDTLAQNQAFNQRILAGTAQTQGQLEASRQTLADRNANFTQMREQQTAAQTRQGQILDAENRAQEQLRATGDQQAQTLLQNTSGDQLAQGQAAAAQRANLLLDQNAPQGPGPTDPQGTEGDTATGQAIARRLAQASSNVRTYGAKAADLMSYQQPGQDIAMAILNNKYGIMPAQSAEQLLRSGSNTRLLPAQVQFRNAGDLSQATDQLIATRGQGALDAAGLAYNNAIQGSNLAQSDTDTIAANKANQAKQDAAFQQQVAGLVSGVGQIGLYGAGRLSGLKSIF